MSYLDYVCVIAGASFALVMTLYQSRKIAGIWSLSALLVCIGCIYGMLLGDKLSKCTPNDHIDMSVPPPPSPGPFVFYDANGNIVHDARKGK